MKTEKTTIPIPGDRYWLEKGKYSGTYVEYNVKYGSYYFRDVTNGHPYMISDNGFVGFCGPFNFEPCE